MPTTLRGSDNLHSAGYLKSNTALSDAAANITATQLLAGEFTITPTVARILTLPIALLTIAEADWTVDGQNSEITIVNAAAFDVTLAVNTGVTIVGRAVINNGSATFRVRRLTSSTVEVTRVSDEMFKSAAKRTRGTAQAIANLTHTIVAYDTLVYDNLGELDATGRFTAKATGIYHASWGALLTNVAWDAGEIVQSRLFKNGSGDATMLRWYSAAAITAYNHTIGAMDINLSAGDYIDIRVLHNQGASVDLHNDAQFNVLSVHRVA